MRESATLTWPVAIDGYEIEEAGVIEVEEVGDGDFFRVLRPVEGHKNTNVRTYDLFRDEPALFRTFTDTPPHEEGFLSFANKYGQLLDHKPMALEQISDWARHMENIWSKTPRPAEPKPLADDCTDAELAEYVKKSSVYFGKTFSLMQRKEDRRPSVRDEFTEGKRDLENATMWDEKIRLWAREIHAMNSLLSAANAYDFRALYSGLTGSIRVELNPRIPDRYQLEAALGRGLPPPINLTLKPVSLLAGMKMQLALHYAEPIGELRKCEYCGKWFYVGPGTGHRSNAKYCSQQCYGRAKHRRHKKRKADAQTTKRIRRHK